MDGLRADQINQALGMIYIKNLKSKASLREKWVVSSSGYIILGLNLDRIFSNIFD